MIHKRDFDYTPHEGELEKASNSYLMSLIAVMAGLPLPIINLIATLAFYIGNKKSTYFVRWHTTQALLSQFSLFFANTCGFWWTINVFFQNTEITNTYIAYMITVFLYNLAEFIATIYTAVAVRNGSHIEWFFYGDLTNEICEP